MKTDEKKPLAKEADKYIVRFPEGMREQIIEAAKVSNRSMNAEIVARLQSTFSHGLVTINSDKDMDKFADALADKLAKRLKAK